jgi:hypothetical protein
LASAHLAARPSAPEDPPDLALPALSAALPPAPAGGGRAVAARALQVTAAHRSSDPACEPVAATARGVLIAAAFLALAAVAGIALGSDAVGYPIGRLA